MDESEIAPSELKRRMDSGDRFALLDVREDFERDYCSIVAPPGVDDYHIRMDEIPARFEEIASIAGPVVVYCHHGVRSRMVQLWLAQRGVSGVLNLDGGIDAWSLQADRTVPRYM
ncbi:MAG: Rhodanese-related sulfurtransferase [Planctomycetota bacterium]|nr:Rhodanese-related sulfurtransferase [Planctomycetota bacterium]